jgi:hypothetical protein
VEEHPAENQRQTLLTVMLSVIALGGFLLFLILVSGGFFLYVVAGALGIFAIGLLHYFAWGNAMHQQTEGDREEERLREELEDHW